MKKPSSKDLIKFMKSQAEIGIEVMKIVTMNKRDIIEIKKQLEVQQSQLKLLAENTGLIDPIPQLKVLDQSVFDGQDEKWRFAAVDKDGRAYAFTRKPEIDQDDPCFIDGDASKCKWIGDGYDATNWKDSLIERDSLACEESNYLSDTMSDIVDELLMIGRGSSTWIDASKHLPKEDGLYLVYYPNYVYKHHIVCFSLNINKFNFFHGEITHWMPLPKPPIASKEK